MLTLSTSSEILARRRICSMANIRRFLLQNSHRFCWVHKRYFLPFYLCRHVPEIAEDFSIFITPRRWSGELSVPPNNSRVRLPYPPVIFLVDDYLLSSCSLPHLTCDRMWFPCHAKFQVPSLHVVGYSGYGARSFHCTYAWRISLKYDRKHCTLSALCIYLTWITRSHCLQR